jgi:hypothetical protein
MTKSVVKGLAVAITLLAPSLVLADAPAGVLTAANEAPAENMDKSPTTTPKAPSGSLSSRLDKTNGVIKPKTDVDPKMQQPAPATGSMPVLRPPAGPGSPSGTEAK